MALPRILLLLPAVSWAFVAPPAPAFIARLHALTRVSEDAAVEPIPFMDSNSQTFIECYPDAVADLDGIQYTIGVPCDHSVALCYFNTDEQLVPVELEDGLMDDVYPIAETIVSEEFGEELVLQRTPQTLTLVGELDDEDDEEEEQDEDDDEDDGDEDEEVEVLLSFQHRDLEFNLVKLLDPVLLVGKSNTDVPNQRFLLDPEESRKIMPLLEDMFLEFHDDEEGLVSPKS